MSNAKYPKLIGNRNVANVKQVPHKQITKTILYSTGANV